MLDESALLEHDSCTVIYGMIVNDAINSSPSTEMLANLAVGQVKAECEAEEGVIHAVNEEKMCLCTVDVPYIHCTDNIYSSVYQAQRDQR
jgi:hypothetical protein